MRKAWRSPALKALVISCRSLAGVEPADYKRRSCQAGQFPALGYQHASKLREDQNPVFAIMI